MSNALTQLVQQIARADESMFVPRAQNPTIHMGVLTGVDYGRSTAAMLTNVPDMTALPTCRWIESYSATNPPAAGDVVRFLHVGTAVHILGRHVVADSAVLLG